jgi:hypothetical protein
VLLTYLHYLELTIGTLKVIPAQRTSFVRTALEVSVYTLLAVDMPADQLTDREFVYRILDVDLADLFF